MAEDKQTISIMCAGGIHFPPASVQSHCEHVRDNAECYEVVCKVFERRVVKDRWEMTRQTVRYVCENCFERWVRPMLAGTELDDKDHPLAAKEDA